MFVVDGTYHLGRHPVLLHDRLGDPDETLCVGQLWRTLQSAVQEERLEISEVPPAGLARRELLFAQSHD